MSFILDALRKADAERERDPARGIHAQPAMQPTGRSTATAWPGWAWALVGVLMAAVIGYVVWPRAMPAPAPGVPVAAPPVVAVPPPPPVAAAPVTPVPAAPAAAVLPAPPPAAPVAAAPPTSPTAARTASPGPQAVASAPTPAPAVAAAGPERVVPQAELPPDVQRELPKVALSGGVYSDNAAQRFVLVNGQLAHEGTEVAPGVLLEQIRPRSAVLRYRQWRYSVTF